MHKFFESFEDTKIHFAKVIEEEIWTKSHSKPKKNI